MSVNLFSLETLAGFILGLLLAFFIKNVFKKKEDLGDYSKNLETLTDKIEEFQEQNAEERGEVKEKLKAAKAARAKAKKEYDWPVIEQRWLDLAKVWEKECK